MKMDQGAGDVHNSGCLCPNPTQWSGGLLHLRIVCLVMCFNEVKVKRVSTFFMQVYMVYRIGGREQNILKPKKKHTHSNEGPRTVPCLW